jgi:hypothetical protein
MSATTNRDIHVEQMLHGYSSGHRLLSSSYALTKSAERYVRTMSDLSGASYKSGFDGYLTGYPLKEDRFFALAKTWFAKDRPRPGCVWTHTLLIPFDSLGQCESLAALLKAFRQPVGDEFGSYSGPLVISGSGDVPNVDEPVEFVANLVDLLYSSPEKVIAIPSENSKEHENLVLALWTQQWPSLQSNFSFCTGALELRLGEHRLDLQIVPSDKRQLERIRGKAKLAIVDERNENLPEEPWIKLAAREVTEPCDRGLTRFLKRFGDPSHRSRSDYRRYGICFDRLQHEGSPYEILPLVALQFPRIDEAISLKSAIAGPRGERAYLGSTPEVDILRSILLSKDVANAFDSSSLSVERRIGELWISQEDDAWRLLIEVANSQLTEPLERVTDAISSIISKDSIARMAVERCDLAAQIVSRNESLAVVSEVWRCPELSLESLGENFIDHAVLQSDFARNVLTAWIVADRHDCARMLSDWIGPDIVPLVLGLDSNTLSLLDRQTRKWHSILSDHGDYCLRWLEKQGHASAEAACLAVMGINPSRNFVDTALLKAWVDSTASTPSLTQKTLREVNVTMLALAFDYSATHLAEPIVRRCFPAVYELAMQNELADRHWEVLQVRLPQSGLWWDKCKKLRMGLLDYCVKNDWSIQTLLQCTAKGYALEQILGSWGLSESEKYFISKVIMHIMRGDGDASIDQRLAAQRYGAWFGS